MENDTLKKIVFFKGKEFKKNLFVSLHPKFNPK